MQRSLLSILLSLVLTVIAAVPAVAQEGAIERTTNLPFYASLHGEVIINASADIVWEVLLDVGSYAEWNPAVVDVQPAEADLEAAGERVQLSLPRWWGDKNQWVKIQVAQAPNGQEPGEWVYGHDDFAARINWLGVQRIHHLEQAGEGQTLFKVTEVYTGAIWTAPINRTQTALESFLVNLKQRAQALSVD